MLSQHYQGNGWWVAGGLLSLFLLSQILLGFWRDRKVGMPVDGKAVAGLSLVFLLFVVLAIYQVLTH
jgi:hypothetical protein